MLTKLSVIDNAYTEVTSERDDGTGQDTYTSHSIKGISLAGHSYSDVECDFPVVHGVEYYLLAIFYDSYDSLNSDDNQIEYVSLFRDKELAYQNATAFSMAVATEAESVVIKDDNGNEYPESLRRFSWGTSFNSIEVIPVSLVFDKSPQ